MRGFCSGSSIEIDLELDQGEVSRLEREAVSGRIRRGHEKPPSFVDIYLRAGTVSGDSLMGLKVIPEGADFEGTTGYEVTLSVFAYGHLVSHDAFIDRPELGTKVTVKYRKES